MDLYTPEQTGSSSTQGFHAIVRFLRVVARHRLILIACIAVAAFLGFVKFSRIPKQYSATTRLMVSEKPSASGNMVIVKGKTSDLGSYQQLILSDKVLTDTVSLLTEMPPELRSQADPTLWPVILRRMLSVISEPKDQTIQIACSSTDPDSTVAVIRALSIASKEFMADYQKDMSVELMKELEANRKSVQQRLETKETALLQARRECGDIALTKGGDETHPLAQRVSRLNDSLTSVRSRRLELQSTMASAQGLVGAGADLTPALQKLESIVGEKVIDRIPGSGGKTTETVELLDAELKKMESELVALRPHYGSGHSEIIRRQSQIAGQRSRIAEAESELRRQISVGIREPQVGQWLINTIYSELLATQQYERSLENEYNIVESKAMLLSDKLAGIQNAEREADTLRDLHRSLLAQLNNIDVNHGSGGFRVASLSEPMVPQNASYPVLSSIMSMFCFIGAGLGLGIIYVMDLMDDRLRSPEEVREELGLAILGVIRRLPDDELKQSKIYIHGFPQTPHSECFRTLKTSITLAPQETKCLAITSTEASEGKTTTTVNLAASYAQTGIRTLLIDADMRRPGLSKLLDVRGKGGLSELLRSEDDIPTACREKVIATDVPLLDVLPCGARHLNPGMLLSMPTLPAILDWAVSEYDQVIVDCPPTLPVSDAAIVGRYVDGLLFLMNPDKTHRRSVSRAVDQLRSMGLKLVGIVANTSLSEDKDSYGYAYTYGYGYGGEYSYGHDEDPDPTEDSENNNVTFGKAA
jgi:polysaccharide biosynthesis transport protein